MVARGHDRERSQVTIVSAMSHARCSVALEAWDGAEIRVIECGVVQRPRGMKMWSKLICVKGRELSRGSCMVLDVLET